ncbi:MAG: hypothetical protein WCS06_09245 [Dysgonamonadaceae bacterium]
MGYTTARYINVVLKSVFLVNDNHFIKYDCEFKKELKFTSFIPFDNIDLNKVNIAKFKINVITVFSKKGKHVMDATIEKDG